MPEQDAPALPKYCRVSCELDMDALNACGIFSTPGSQVLDTNILNRLLQLHTIFP